MKKRRFLLFMICVQFLIVAHAGNQLLGLFHEDIPKPVDLFSMEKTTSIPAHIVHKYLDPSLNFIDDDYIDNNRIRFFAHSKIKSDGYWLLLYSAFDGTVTNVYLATYDELNDKIMAKLHIKRMMKNLTYNMDYMCKYNEALPLNEQEICVSSYFMHGVEDLPTKLKETYLLNKYFTFIESEDYAFENDYLTYKTSKVEDKPQDGVIMNEDEFLSYFKTYNRLSDIHYDYDNVPEGTKLLPDTLFRNFLFLPKNGGRFCNLNKGECSYYALGKVWAGNCWILVYRPFYSIHFEDLFLASYVKGNPHPTSILRIFSYGTTESKLVNNLLEITYKSSNWPLPGANVKKEYRRLDANFTVIKP